MSEFDKKPLDEQDIDAAAVVLRDEVEELLGSFHKLSVAVALGRVTWDLVVTYSDQPEADFRSLCDAVIEDAKLRGETGEIQ